MDDDGWGEMGDDEDAEQETDPRALKEVYEAHAKVVRDMEKKGPTYRDSPALETLRAARDAAERAWRGAKAPAPLPVRMGRAETKLDRASAALTRARHALDEFDEWAERRREELVRAMDEADGWYRWRQQQLDQLHEEAGEKVAGKRHGAEAAGPATDVRAKIKSNLLPAVQEIMEHVEGNPEIIERLSLIAEGLEEAERHLDVSQAKAGAEKFDIGADDSGNEGTGRGRSKGAGDRSTRCYGDDAWEERKDGKASAWKSEGAGRWTRRTMEEDGRPRGKGAKRGSGETSAADSGGAAAPMAPRPTDPADTAQRGPSADGATTAAALAGTAAAMAANTGPSRGTGATAGGDGARGSAGGPADRDEEDDVGREQAAKFRRRRTEAEARQESDARKAMELLQEQQAAMAAQMQSHQAGTGGFGSEAALSMAAQKFVHEVRQAEARAARKGVEPKSEGRALLEISPMELQQWVRENLGEESDGEY